MEGNPRVVVDCPSCGGAGPAWCANGRTQWACHLCGNAGATVVRGEYDRLMRLPEQAVVAALACLCDALEEVRCLDDCALEAFIRPGNEALAARGVTARFRDDRVAYTPGSPHGSRSAVVVGLPDGRTWNTAGPLERTAHGWYDRTTEHPVSAAEK